MRSQSKHQAPLTGKVVLDAMGSDHAPHVEIDGAIRNAIRSVKEFSDHRTSERIEEGIKYEADCADRCGCRSACICVIPASCSNLRD